MRREFVWISSIITAALILAGLFISKEVLWAFVLVGPLLVIGYRDYFQKKHTIRRNFPIFGNFRYLFEAIRPEINQYFVESNTDGVPFSREERSLVYQRSKRDLDSLPFGTQKNVYQDGYEWLSHSILASHVDPNSLRIDIGGSACKQPYSASILNISAMSYGSLSKNAVMALNGGAKDGGCAHNTGEGGLSPYHLEHGGDLIWQIGTGYFSARGADGRFSEEVFAQRAVNEKVKMIELKISQGAKPGHGGILPAKKITPEIAAIRDVPMGQDVISPPSHSEFSNPVEMMHFIKRLRDASGGKPVGFKLCIGKRREFISICKAMEKTGIMPDYISIDGGEGGTGAAPLEFSNHVGMPGVESLVFAHNCLQGFGVRDQIKVMTSGRITSGFDIIKRLAIGADAIYSARAFLLSLGCIQALRCHSNHCPTGVATQNPDLVAGLVVPEKRTRVTSFHHETVRGVAELLGAMGLEHSRELRPWHLMRRTNSTEIRHYGEIYNYIQSGVLKNESTVPEEYMRAWKLASPDSFRV
jgi:glutamate synthase domain-containing protein 2